jgi:ankyrin repeat protein
LISKGAELDAVTDDTNETPLHLAAKNGDYGMVVLLIKLGANDTIRDNFGRKARDVASAYNHSEVAEFLTKYLQ